MKALTHAEIEMLKAWGYIEGNASTVPDASVFGAAMRERIHEHEAKLAAPKADHKPAAALAKAKRQPKGKTKHG